MTRASPCGSVSADRDHFRSAFESTVRRDAIGSADHERNITTIAGAGFQKSRKLLTGHGLARHLQSHDERTRWQRSHHALALFRDRLLCIARAATLAE